MEDKWKAKVYKKNVKKQRKEDADSWQKLRKACLEHDHYCCQRCDKRNGQGRGLSAHHIIPRSEGGLDDIDNLITLCLGCHDYVEINELKSRSKIMESFDDGIVVKTFRDSFSRDVNRPDWHSWVYGSGKKPTVFIGGAKEQKDVLQTVDQEQPTEQALAEKEPK